MPMCARDLMTAPPLTVPPDARFLQIQSLFLEAQIQAAPIADEDGHVLGWVTSTHLMSALDLACDEDIDPGEPLDHAGDLKDQLDELTALEIGSPEPVWVAPETPITEVAQRMRKEGIHQVLVGTDGRVAGMLTTFDLLQAVR